MGIKLHYGVPEFLLCFWQWNSFFGFNQLLDFITNKSGLPDDLALGTYFDYFCKKYAGMDTLIVHLDKSADKAKLKSALELIRGIASVSDTITRSDFEEMADDVLIKEMRKAEKGPLLSYEDGKKEFSRIKKRLTK